MITEEFFDRELHNEVHEARKVPICEKFEIAQVDGSIHTLEGIQLYKAGYYIITGILGEQYAIPEHKFKELKEDMGDGKCIPKSITKLTRVADHDGFIDTPWGIRMEYKAGEDVIVRHGENDYGVVKARIFGKTYQLINP